MEFCGHQETSGFEVENPVVHGMVGLADFRPRMVVDVPYAVAPDKWLPTP
jgi:hypothetical protein